MQQMIGTFCVGGEPDLLVPVSIFLGAPADRKLTNLDERIVVGHGEERVDVERCFAAGQKGNVIAHECPGEIAVSVLALVVAWLPVGVVWLRPLTFVNTREQANGEPVGRGVFERILVVVGNVFVEVALMGRFPRFLAPGTGFPLALISAKQVVVGGELLVCLFGSSNIDVLDKGAERHKGGNVQLGCGELDEHVFNGAVGEEDE
jgi:hypothetical protein